MAEAPKIPRLIRERVRAQQAGFRSQAEHPDADVLTAFSENTLAREERSQVMNHLGDCEACRDVVMLSQTMPDQDAKPIRLPARPFLSWMTLRWASLAAVFAMAIGVVVMERSSRPIEGFTQQGPTTDVVQPAGANEQEQPTATTKADLAAAKEKDAKVADARARGKVATEKPVAPPPAPAQGYARIAENRTGRLYLGEAQSRSERAAGRGALAKDEFSSASNAVAAKQEMIRNRGQLPVEITNNSETRDAGVDSGAAQDSARPAAPDSQAYTFAPAPSAPPPASSAAESAAAPATGGSAPLSDSRLARKKSTDEVAPKATAERALQRTGSREDKGLTAQTEVTVTSGDANFQAKDQQAGLTTENLAAASPVPMRWRLREGKLQHSADEGKTWQEINLEPGVNLHSFWIQGGNVWAGGTGGSLYQVTSQGKNAVRIPLKVSGGDVSQTVVTISFSDERNGIIRLENGQILRTADGGKTWERF